MSRKKSRAKTLQQEKEARAKKIAIGGGVVLVAVLAFQGRHLLSHGSSSATPAPAVTTTTDATGAPTTTPTTAPTTVPPTTAPGTAAAAMTPTASTKLPDSEEGPKQGKGQLYSFSHFSDKDPFVQQVSASSATGSASGTPTSTPASSPTGTATASAGGPNTTPQAQSRMLAAAGTAKISINGKVQTVRVGASFPSANPLFRLVSLTHGVARIGIANGSYASGAQTLSLAGGRSVTLADTADGVRYKLRLISAG
jgi:hypothetical protein